MQRSKISMPTCLKPLSLIKLCFNIKDFFLSQDLNIETRNSVQNISTLREETYLCPSSIKYIKPVRAINSKGQWRIVLNHLEAKNQFISQSIRVELCHEAGQACPKIPGLIIFFFNNQINNYYFKMTTTFPMYIQICILFSQITIFIKVCMAFVFGLQTLCLIDFTKIY